MERSPLAGMWVSVVKMERAQPSTHGLPTFAYHLSESSPTQTFLTVRGGDRRSCWETPLAPVPSRSTSFHYMLCTISYGCFLCPRTRVFGRFINCCYLIACACCKFSRSNSQMAVESNSTADVIRDFH